MGKERKAEREGKGKRGEVRKRREEEKRRHMEEMGRVIDGRKGNGWEGEKKEEKKTDGKGERNMITSNREKKVVIKCIRENNDRGAR